VAPKGEGVDALEAEPGGGDDGGLAQVDDEGLEAERSKMQTLQSQSRFQGSDGRKEKLN
jgi:hypothetical protein